MADNGPALLRPVPRRPFQLNVTNATPPDDEEDTYKNELSPEDKAEFLRIYAAHDSAGAAGAAASSPISRNTSSMNLNSSTLYGIYADTDRDPDRLLTEGDTPWGADAQTPLRRSSADDATYEIMRFRSGHHRRGRSMDTAIHHSGPRPTAVTALSLVARGGVLFALGVGYGVILVTRFRDSSQWPTVPFREGLVQTGYGWGTLILYGVAGVILGTAMPWADGVWGDALGDEEEEDADVTIVSDPNAVESPGHTTDGVLVMRAIGAFVGIVFAIVSLNQAHADKMVPAADIRTTAQTGLGIDAANLHHPRPRQPAPLVAHRSVQGGLHPLGSRQPRREHLPPRHQAGHDAHPARPPHPPRRRRRRRRQRRSRQRRP